MMIMELPAGANKNKRDIAIHNLQYMMEHAHAIRCPGICLFSNMWSNFKEVHQKRHLIKLAKVGKTERKL